MNNIHTHSKGFTIFELMIATVVFGSLLAILTSTMLVMTNQFYKGVNSSKTQQAARTILDQIARITQLSPSSVQLTAPTGTNGGVLCFTGTSQALHYTLNRRLTDDDSSPWATALTNDCTPQALSATLHSHEFLGPNMRLSNLDISPNPCTGLCTITVTVAYGTDDLLNNPNSTTPTCKPGTGSQYCAVTTINQTVLKRF